MLYKCTCLSLHVSSGLEHLSECSLERRIKLSLAALHGTLHPLPLHRIVLRYHSAILSLTLAGAILQEYCGLGVRRYRGYQPYFLPKELYKFVSGVAFHIQWTTATYERKYHGPPTPTAAQGGPPHHRQSDRTLPTGRLDATSTDSWLRLRWRATALAAKV